MRHRPYLFFHVCQMSFLNTPRLRSMPQLVSLIACTWQAWFKPCLVGATLCCSGSRSTENKYVLPGNSLAMNCWKHRLALNSSQFHSNVISNFVVQSVRLSSHCVYSSLFVILRFISLDSSRLGWFEESLRNPVVCKAFMLPLGFWHIRPLVLNLTAGQIQALPGVLISFWVRIKNYFHYKMKKDTVKCLSSISLSCTDFEFRTQKQYLRETMKLYHVRVIRTNEISFPSSRGAKGKKVSKN